MYVKEIIPILLSPKTHNYHQSKLSRQIIIETIKKDTERNMGLLPAWSKLMDSVEEALGYVVS